MIKFQLPKGACLSPGLVTVLYTDSKSNTFFSYRNLMVNSSNESFLRIWRFQILGTTFKYQINVWNSGFAHSDTVQQKTLQNYKVLFLTGVLMGPNTIWFRLLVHLTEKQMCHINSSMKFTSIPRKLYGHSKFSRQNSMDSNPKHYKLTTSGMGASHWASGFSFLMFALGIKILTS